MKEATLLLALALVGAMPLAGQIVHFRLGAASSEVYEPHGEYGDPRGGPVGIDDSFGPTGGVYLDIPRNGMAFRTGALWWRKWDQFIELPVMVLIGSNARNDGPKVFATVGASLGIRTLCSAAQAWRRTVAGCAVEPFDLSGAFGAGFTLPLRPNLSVGAEIVYLRGLTEIDGTTVQETKARGFLATAGIGIPLG